MSIQMTFIFLCLVFEMALMSLLVLPLPFQVRKLVVQVSDMLFNSTHYRVIIGFLAFIVSLLFMDSAKRSTISYNKGRHSRPGYGDEPLYLNSFEMASKNYNQRNLYITGAVLYLGLCIPTVVNILKKLIKHKTKYDTAIKNPVTDASTVEDLQKAIKSKDVDIATLRKQIDMLTATYQKAADDVAQNQDVQDKKND